MALTLKPTVHEKLPAIAADIYECQVVDIRQEVQKENLKYKIAGGEEVIKLGFAVVEESPNYGYHFWKGNIKYKLSAPGTYAASTLWEICCAIKGEDLTQAEKADLFDPAKLEAFLTNARLRLVVQVKQGDDSSYNVITGYMPRKVQGLVYDKAKSDALHYGAKNDAVESLPANGSIPF